MNDRFQFDNEDDKQNKDTVLDKCQSFCIGKTNVTYERYLFNMCCQQEHETFYSYFPKLRKLAKTCEYGTLTDSLIKDRLVIGIRDNG